MWGPSLPTKVDDVVCEAFRGVGLQVLVTAMNQSLVQVAVNNFTALPSGVTGGVEGGIGNFYANSTLDQRPGITCQLWAKGTGAKSKLKLEKEFVFRVLHSLLTTPTVALFNDLHSQSKFNISRTIGFYGDGFETHVEKYDRHLISIPLMMGHDFLIEEEIAYKEGVMGGFLWLFCDSVIHALTIGQKAVEAVRNLPNIGVIFGVCASGSKLRSINYPGYGPSTNQMFCPTLRSILPDSRVPPNVKSIPELVFNAFDLPTLKRALKAVITAIHNEEGLIRISSQSFGGQLGDYSISLRDL